MSTVSRIIEELTNPRKISLIILAISIVTASGIFFVLVNRPAPMAGTSFIWPAVNGETSTEFLIIAFMYTLALGGLWLVYDATRHKYRGDYINQVLLGGSLIFVLTLMILLVISNVMK